MRNYSARAERYDIRNLDVDIRTIGTNLTFRFNALNISSTGLLLEWNNSIKTPFIPTSTILEIDIDSDCKRMSKPIRCLGKIIREIDREYGECLGIYICQIESEDSKRWEEFLDTLTLNQKLREPPIIS